MIRSHAGEPRATPTIDEDGIMIPDLRLAHFHLRGRLRRGSPVLMLRRAAFALSLAPFMVFAQTTNADAGSTLWSAFRSVLYGPWGLVGSAVVVAMGIYMFLERGFMHALGVMAAGALIFFVPLIVISMRNTAQALGGGG
jgi:hypothetical protein